MTAGRTDLQIGEEKAVASQGSSSGLDVSFEMSIRYSGKKYTKCC